MNLIAIVAAVVIAPVIVSAILGAPLPWLVALVTNSEAATWVKRLVSIVASIVVSIVTVSLVSDSAVVSWDTVLGGLFAFLAAENSYAHIGKRIGLNEKPYVLPEYGLGGK